MGSVNDQRGTGARNTLWPRNLTPEDGESGGRVLTARVSRGRAWGWSEKPERRSHWVRACTTSFTSMVPITIFSLLTVSWAGPGGRATRVSRTRLPLVSVLPANLRGRGGGREGLSPGDGPPLRTRPSSPSLPGRCPVPVLVRRPTRDTTQVGSGGHFLHHNVVAPAGVRQRELLRDLVHARQLSWGQRS